MATGDFHFSLFFIKPMERRNNWYRERTPNAII